QATGDLGHRAANLDHEPSDEPRRAAAAIAPWSGWSIAGRRRTVRGSVSAASPPEASLDGDPTAAPSRGRRVQAIERLAPGDLVQALAPVRQGALAVEHRDRRQVHARPP